MKAFDPEKIPLEGVHLIEASAGTGKTYSIEGLYVRLVENGLRPDQILVVTFTEAATSELRDRIRARLGKRLRDPGMDAASGPGALIRSALLSFDTAAIFTIHGFCRRMLSEMAFETGSAFTLELTPDESEIARDIAWDFFRISVYGLPKEYLQFAGLDPDDFLELAYAAGIGTRVIPDSCRPDIENAIDRHSAFLQGLNERWIQEASDIGSILRCAPELNRQSYQKKTVENALNDMDAFVRLGFSAAVFDRFKYFRHSRMCEKSIRPISAPLHPFFEYCDRFAESQENLESAFGMMTIWLKRQFVDFFRDRMPPVKEFLGVMHYDDLLVRMRDAVRSKDSYLVKAVREKFRAALIDEFQDTDPVQWEIFGTVFSPGTMYLIGDPKQAIYGFRGADIFTYLDAKRGVAKENSHRLDTNRRSVEGLVEAVNHLFRNNPFGQSGIPYDKVNPCGREPVTGLDGPPMRIWIMQKDGDDPISKTDATYRAASAVASEAARLIASGLVLPGQIAVLARKWRQANIVRDALTAAGLKCAITSEEKVFESDEALLMGIFLNAVYDNAREDLLRACLATPLFGMSASEIMALDEDAALRDGITSEFFGYGELWRNHGFMRMFMDFYERRGRLNLARLPRAERRLTNMQHLAELLHREESSGRTGMDSLVCWLNEKMTQPMASDEAELRLESDDDAIRIMTVHKSKGLQFPVVFLPFAWDELNDRVVVFHDGSGRVIDLGSEEILENTMKSDEENMQENMRLLYVGLTRAIDRCYLACGDIKTGETALSNLLDLDRAEDEGILNLLNQYDGKCIKVEAMPEPAGRLQMVPGEKGLNLACREFSGSIDSRYSVMSYSSIATGAFSEGRDMDAPEGARAVQPDDLSVFALPKGAATGNMVHEVLELVDFTSVDEGLIYEVMHRHGFGEEWRAAVTSMVRSLMRVDIDGRARLGEIAKSRRLPELEFILPVSHLDAGRLEDLFVDDGDLRGIFEMLRMPHSRGFIRGFIDLVFEAGGRYYIIDWKTNYLGPGLEYYNLEAMKAVMKDEFYVLQYHIYTLAVHRYLSARIRDYSYDRHFGGVLYLFTRGVDNEKGTGIYRARPDLKTIDAIAEGLLGEAAQ